jgi:hypothetical protein
MRRLNIHMDIQAYVNRYGVPDAINQYGTRIWYGLRQDLRDWLSLGGGRGSPGWALGNLVPGWFAAPNPFSRANARHAIEDVPGHIYPALFVPLDSGEYEMWCQHLLIRRTGSWVVHCTRVQLVSDIENGRAFFRELEV